jgi:large subunit ribosomal protein L9
MQVILLERIEKLGQMGDVVTVKDGYARNFLLPQNKALRRTAENEARFETQKIHLEAVSLERKSEAESVAEKLAGLKCILLRQASDTGRLYGSVNSGDLAQAVTEAGFSIDRKQIRLTATIKTTGIQSVQISLHPEVSVEIFANVARSADEAEAQEAGASTEEAEAAGEAQAADPEAVFESAELAARAQAAGDDDEAPDGDEAPGHGGDAPPDAGAGAGEREEPPQ